MLTIHRSGRQIVTDREMSVKLEWINPVCFFDGIKGDVGLGLDFANNEYTRAEFSNPERYEKLAGTNNSRLPDIELRFRGMLLQRGTMVVTSADKEKIASWLQSDLGTLGVNQRDKNLSEMDWPTGQVFENKTTYDPSTDDYSCPSVKNPVFWEGKGRNIPDPDNENETINRLTSLFKTNKQYFVNKIISETGLVDTSGEACVVSPYLYLNYAISEMLRINNFFVDPTDNPLADQFFSILLYNNFNIFKQTFTVEQVELGYWDYNTNEFVVYNTVGITSMAWSLEPFNYADLVPKIQLKEFILSIQNWLNVVLHFRNDNTVKVVNRNLIPDADAFNLDEYFVGHWNIGERKNVSLKFIQELDDNDDLNEDWHDLSDRRADFHDPVATHDALLAVIDPALGDLRLVIDEDKIYEYKWAVFSSTDENLYDTQSDVLEWTFVSIMPQPYFYGTSEEIEEIKTTASTLPKLQGGIVPQTKQKGNVASARSLWADYSLRCIPAGLLALNDGLRFDSEYGLFIQRWENWARFWCQRLPVEGEFNLPLNVLQYVINNITQPFSTRHGKFIIETMSCDFQGDQMGVVQIKGYKVE